jgi:hypothetical protein
MPSFRRTRRLLQVVGSQSFSSRGWPEGDSTRDNVGVVARSAARVGDDAHLSRALPRFDRPNLALRVAEVRARSRMTWVGTDAGLVCTLGLTGVDFRLYRAILAKETHVHLSSKPIWHRGAAGVLLLALVAAAHSQSPNVVGCLSKDQQVELTGRNEHLLTQFDLIGDLQRSSEMHKQLATLRLGAKACARRTALDLSISRLTEECEATVAEFNRLADETNDLDEQIKFKQQFLLNQLSVERGRYPSC